MLTGCLQASRGRRAGRPGPGRSSSRPAPRASARRRWSCGPRPRRAGSTTRWPSAVLRTRRSGASSTGRPVRTRPSSSATTWRAEVVADRRARVQDRAEQLVLAVLGADRREVGADPLPSALDAVAAAAAVGAGAEEDLAAVVGVARPADQLDDRRQGPAARPSWAAAGPRRPRSRTLRSGWLFRTVVASVLRSSGSLPVAWPASSSRWPPSLEPGEGPERLAAEAERVVVAGDQAGEPRVGVADAGAAPGRRPRRRGRARLALAPRRSGRRGTRAAFGGLIRPSGLDGGDPDLLAAPSRRGRSPSGRRAVRGVAGRGGQRDPLRAAARGRSGPTRSAAIDLRRRSGRRASRRRACGRAWPGAAASAAGSSASAAMLGQDDRGLAGR